MPTAIVGNRQIRLSWTAPDANGARILSYTIRCISLNSGNHRCDGILPDGTNNSDNTYHPITGTSYTITGLTNGVNYSFSVQATNSAGDSDLSEERRATPAAPPGPPTDITINPTYPGNSGLTLGVSWSVPADADSQEEFPKSGGVIITGYTVQYRASGGNWSFHYFGGEPNTEITGLIIGHRYDVQIRTHNNAGESSWATASATPTGKPAAPTIDSVTEGANQLTIAWNAPDPGASAITSYNVQRCTASETERTVDGSSVFTYRCTSGWSSAGTTTVGTTDLTISNLACGTRFGVRVQAINSYGSGPWSAIDSDDATWSDETDACP